MADKKDDIKTRLLATFRVEAQEHLQAITTNLLALERGLPPAEAHQVVETTFREVHTLKGAARSVSLLDVEALCQAMESVLSRISRGDLVLGRQVLDLFHEGVDGVARLLVGGEAPAGIRKLIGRIEEAAAEAGVGEQESGAGDQKPTVEAPAPTPQPATPGSPVDTVRLTTARLDALLLKAEDLLVPKLAARERVRQARVLVEALMQLRKTLSQGSPDIRRLPPSGGHPSTPAPQPLAPDLRAVEALARQALGHLTRDERMLAGVVDVLLEEMRRLRIMPASTVLDLFPRMVRDLAYEHGKEVEWVAQGADLEVDRKVLQTMKEPLIHLVRNAIDHGIEPPEARTQAGKPRRGRVAVTISSLEGNRIEIQVEDDGAGIDLTRVREAAVRSRLMSAEEAQDLTDEHALDLVYRSGLSTSPIITDLSGHGLGLAIVKERVEGLGGQILVKTLAGSGTTVWMLLPASIATFRGLPVRAGGQSFLLPVEAVERAVRLAPERIESVEGRPTIRWNGHPLSLARLGDILGLPQGQGLGVRGQGLGTGLGAPIPNPKPPTPKLPCVILRSGEEEAAFMVEEILGEQEVLVKELRPPLVRVRNVAGAGLLGTGQVVLILRPRDLLQSLRQRPRPPAPPAAPKEDKRQRVILVVDDSITTRMMEKNLLEAAGFRVRVAVDGIEAWTLLKSEEFDLVVSDVDMPRLDGCDLTARIRADRKLADLPVVLVTALESREDKERGIEVGANAYVVKSSFDQSNLLEIIRRLI